MIVLMLSYSSDHLLLFCKTGNVRGLVIMAMFAFFTRGVQREMSEGVS